MDGETPVEADEASHPLQNGPSTSEAANNSAVGVLTRTVFSSPEVHWILPASLRPDSGDQALRNDIAFVGSRGVEVREVLPALNFQRVAAHLDFGARILGATVLDVHFAPSVDAPMLDAGEIKIEDGDGAGSRTPDSRKLPAQLLLLTLESQELLLVHLGTSQTSQTPFIVQTTPLPAEPNHLSRLGYFVATDPASRAFAVAAYTNRLLVYSTRPVNSYDGIANDVIRDHVLLKIESGHVVLHMDFLHSIPGHENMIHLILIVAKERKIKLMLYAWECNKELTPDTIQLSYNHPLSREMGMPTLLVPLKLSNAPGSFMLVSESSITLYTNSHLRWPQPSTPLKLYQHDVRGQLDRREESSSPGGSSNPALWTAWARPARNTSSSDDLYLGREDGLVWYVHIEKTHDKIEMTRRGEAGKLEGNIGSAFTTLNLGLNVGDTILFNGELSNGGFYEIGRMYPTIDGSPEGDEYDELSRADLMKLRKRDTFHNWTPFLDVATLSVVIPYQPSSKANSYESLHLPNSERLYARHTVFATSGKNSSGSICQMRFGLEVPLRTRMYEEELRGASQIWALCGDTYQDFVILAFPHETVAITNFNSREPACSLYLADEPTLAANNLNLIRQEASDAAAESMHFTTLLVTPNTIKHLIYADAENISLDKEHSCPGTIVAAIEPEALLVLRVYRDESKHVVSVHAVSTVEGEYILLLVGESLSVNVELTCACFFPLIESSSLRATYSRTDDVMGSRTILAGLGTSDGRIVILEIDAQNGPRILLDQQLYHEQELSSEWACESIVVLEYGKDLPTDATKMLLLCGTRNGLLFCFDLVVDPAADTVAVSSSSCVSLGSTGVRIRKDIQHKNNAFVHCDTEICYFSYDGNRDCPVLLQSIWFVDRSDASFSHEGVSSITQLPLENKQGARRMAGNLVCLSEGCLMFGPIERTSQALPRKWPVPGTPNRLIFSSHLQKLVVATNTIQVDEKKRRRASVAFMYLMSLQEKPSSDDHRELGVESASTAAPTLIYRGQPGEKITGILEWEVFRDGKRYHLLVASKVCQLSDKTETGGLVYIQIRGKKVQPHDTSEESQPVRCMCLYRDSLLLCSGDKLKMRTLSPEMRFHKRTLYRLKSPGLHISVVEPFVYVTTARHSLMAFKFEGNELMPCASDTGAMEGLYHLALPEHNLLLFSDKHCSVLGVRPAQGSTNSEHFERRFEAKLPCSMTRLFQANLSPVWRDKSTVGIVQEDVYGTATDGSLLSFKIVTEAAWRLLRFVQNMCIRDATICRQQVQHSFRATHVEPSGDSPSGYHIDGDILCRLVARKDAKEMFESMLDKSNEDLENNSSSLDFNSAQERRMRFVELVDALRQSIDLSTSDLEPARRHLHGLHENDDVRTALKFMEHILELPF